MGVERGAAIPTVMRCGLRPAPFFIHYWLKAGRVRSERTNDPQGGVVEDQAYDILFAVSDGIGCVTFTRPQARNSFTFQMYERLAEICQEANENPALKALILTGAGDKAFASGTDINQ